jgi:hypothetical protein
MNIKKDNKKYPLKEYFLDRKPLEDCSPECQEQVADLGKKNPLEDEAWYRKWQDDHADEDPLLFIPL